MHGVGHDQKLHQIIVGGRTGGLHQKHVLTSDVFVHFYRHFAVTEAAYTHVAKFEVKLICHAFGQRCVRVAGKQH